MADPVVMGQSRPILNPYGDLFALLGPVLQQDPEAARQIRRKLVWAYAWAVPSRQAIATLVAHSPLIEVGAGTGYWAWLLRQAGADVLAVDRNPEAAPRWSQVELGGPETIPHHPERALFLCWPPLNEPLAAECLEAYRGDMVLSVGDAALTGDKGFETMLARDYQLELEVPLPNWPACSDRLCVYRRRQSR